MTERAAIFDFDDNAEWGPRLWDRLRPYLPGDMAQIVRATEPEFIEDAADVVLAHADQRVLSKVMTNWLRSHRIRGYHGTRVNAIERASIRRDGLLPLRVHQHTERLERALSQHPRWAEVKHALQAAFKLFEPGMRSGAREGQAHLTVSRAGLVNGFNHYLKKGSEFDWHVSHHLLGPEGQAFMAADGQPYLIALLVPGDAALTSCNRYGMPTDDFPNLVSDLFRVWSYWLGYPDYRASCLKIDCGMVIFDIVPACWIDCVEKIGIH